MIASPPAVLRAVHLPAIVASLVLLALRAHAQTPAPLPAPSYDTTFYALAYGDGLAEEQGFTEAADELLARVAPGPYAKTGFADYFTLDMAWAGDPAQATLTSPSETSLRALLDRARARGLVFHIAAMAGASRATTVYTDAKREDRRNAQWFADGRIVPSSFSGGLDASIDSAYATPSRYARKLRRHLEAKVRAFAKRTLALRADYPDTLVSASGDAEMELNSEALDEDLSFERQPIADYSPFAVLEFRDWLLHQGLYADGAIYAGDGYTKAESDTFTQGAGALAADNLARFDADFGTPFTSWSLEHFPWSLADPIDADPGAIASAEYGALGWSPLPSSGPDYVAGGFDAPRSWNEHSPRFWATWLQFRATMLASYARDFATWMTTTPGATGETLSPARWYSHQIPADFLNGTHPGSAKPERRLLTAASPLWTSLVGEDVGSPGLTVLDRYESGDVVGSAVYRRTSQYLFAVMPQLGLPSWGMPEYSPSWPIDVLPDENRSSIASQLLRAYDAGAHLLCFTPWPHFVDTADGEALGDLVDQVKYQPRGPRGTPWSPPAVRGLAAGFGAAPALGWQAEIFEGTPGFTWGDWPLFHHFELWRGATPDFTTADGTLAGAAFAPAWTDPAPSSAQPYYRVLAVSRTGHRGAFSNAVQSAALVAAANR